MEWIYFIEDKLKDLDNSDENELEFNTLDYYRGQSYNVFISILFDEVKHRQATFYYVGTTNYQYEVMGDFLDIVEDIEDIFKQAEKIAEEIEKQY